MKLRTALAAATALGLAAGPLVSTISADAGPVAVSKVVVLTDNHYVDKDEESANLIDDLQAGGHSVSRIADVTDEADFLARLDAAEVFLIPELERDSGAGPISVSALDEDLTEAEVTGIQDFVDGGGRIVFFGSADPTYVINPIFDFDLEHIGAWCDDPSAEADAVGVSPAADVEGCELTAAAASTELADGPTPLGFVSRATGLIPASLPAGSTTFYSGVATSEDPAPTEIAPAAAVTLAGAVSMPYGDGVVVFLGWDWFPQADTPSEGSVSAADAADEADWANVLDLTVSQPEVTASPISGGKVTFTSDSPSTQPVFVSFIVNGVEQTVTIAPKTTSASVDGLAADIESASFSVPGWGIGEGDVAVASATETPAAQPVTAPVPFTG